MGAANCACVKSNGDGDTEILVDKKPFMRENMPLQRGGVGGTATSEIH